MRPTGVKLVKLNTVPKKRLGCEFESRQKRREIFFFFSWVNLQILFFSLVFTSVVDDIIVAIT